MKITVSGPAAATHLAEDSEIIDPQILKRFHGVKSDESCIDYFDDALGEIGLVGGRLEFVFDEPSQRLRICTVYYSPRELKEKELERLVAETRGQWSDGIGENGLHSGDDDVGLSSFPVLSSVDLNDVRVEQVDDGVTTPRPKKSPLFAAVQKNDVRKIAQLLDAGEPIDPRDREGNTPLISAVWGNDCQNESATLLIERGAELNAANKHGYTPVLLAAMHGYNDVLKALLEAGADPNYVDPQDYTEHYPLHLACNRRQEKAVQLLVEHGANVNQACSSGYTALMHLQAEDVEIARFLVTKGADIGAKNSFNQGMDEKLKRAIA